MDVKDLTALVQGAGPNKVVRLTFKPGRDSITALQRLTRAYCKPGGPSVSSNYDIIVMAVLESRDWENDRNRTIGFTGLSLLDGETLAHFARDIEKAAA